MWKVAFVLAALAVSASPLDAAPDERRKVQKSELRRDVDRISKEIYPKQRRAPKKR